MKRLSIMFFLLTQTWAHAGDEVNNGGGSAEKTVLYAFDHLPEYLHICLVSSSCNLEKDERSVLEQMLQNQDLEKSNSSLLQFQSETQSPGFFIIDGVP